MGMGGGRQPEAPGERGLGWPWKHKWDSGHLHLNISWCLICAAHYISALPVIVHYFSPQSWGTDAILTRFTDKEMKAQRHPAISSRTQSRAELCSTTSSLTLDRKTKRERGMEPTEKAGVIQVVGKGEHLYYVSTSQAQRCIFLDVTNTPFHFYCSTCPYRLLSCFDCLEYEFQERKTIPGLVTTHYSASSSLTGT